MQDICSLRIRVMRIRGCLPVVGSESASIEQLDEVLYFALFMKNPRVYA
jgi:hypothetical protein